MTLDDYLMDGYPKEGWDFSDDGGYEYKLTNKYLCPTADKSAVINSIMYGVGPGPLKSIGSEPFDNKTNPEMYTISATWSLDARLSTDTLLVESIEPNCEFLTLDTDQLKWADGTAINSSAAPGVLIKSFDWSLTRYKANAVPEWVFDAIGKVNQQVYHSYAFGKAFAAGTLLLGSFSINKETSQANINYTNGFKFSFRSQTWNKFYNTKLGNWQYIVDADNNAIYPYGSYRFGDA